MPLLRRARLLTNKLLGPFGWAVSRTEKTKWFWGNPIITARVGNYSIQVPSLNPISTHYSRYPDYMSQLGRLAALVKRKYPGAAALDIGANVGDTACIIRTAADIPLLCIEGDDYTFGFLEKNLRQFQNAAAHRLFLGENTGEVAMTFEKSGWNATLKPTASGNAQKIKITSLDDFFAPQPNVQANKLVKVDAEGFDCAILRGARKFLRRAHPVLTLEYNRDNMEAIGEEGLGTLWLLSDLGYAQAVFHDANGRFLCLTKLTDRNFIQDLHDYADGRNGGIYYYDITAFSETDDDLALQFAEAERVFRKGTARRPEGGERRRF